ncbi:MAG: hypothetical protein KJ795_04395 [Gammaproteobacteria bacterium]|nr:hypothetical protein [Gammaproteobacteria bacterium]MBU1776596.1 hypothetical protein [Gammaproteobacteria bacterium]MBU1968963.1 hypothetical protein [Gammaproteobacteria bacterium]
MPMDIHRLELINLLIAYVVISSFLSQIRHPNLADMQSNYNQTVKYQAIRLENIALPSWHDTCSG